ncbi:MAG: PKD domain-containing protein [Flavobacteriales bacterium]|jgi:PKD repeat protein
MKKNFTPFERGLKDKMEQFEFPYEQGAWAGLQHQMGMAKSGGSVWIVSLISTVVVLSGTAIAIYRQQHVPSTAKKAEISERLSSPITSITRGISHGGSLLVPTTANYTSAQYSNSLETPVLNISNVSGVESNVQLEAFAENTISPATTKPSKDLAVKADNVIAFNCNVRRACQGEEVEFQTTSGPKNGSYLWNFGDGHFSDDINPKHKFGKAGHYDVSLSITSDNGQINTTVINDMITIDAAPDADFTWEFVNTNPAAPEVRIINLTDGGSSYEWSNGAQSFDQANGATFKLNTGGRQMIALNAKNEAGCSDGAVKHISVNTDFTLEAPQSWSFAKGTFMPAGLKKNKVDFSMVILDSNGNKVYQTTSRLKGWDGKLPNGSMAQAGSQFNYMVIITNDLTQEQKYFNGPFTVSP